MRTTAISMNNEELVREASQPKILIGTIAWISN